MLHKVWALRDDRLGVKLGAQSIWPWPPSVCTPSPQGWSSSPGLQITLQP